MLLYTFNQTHKVKNDEILIYELPSHGKVYWSADLAAVRIQWLDLFMSLEDFKTICKKAIGVVRKKESKIWIADSSLSEGVFSSAIQDYIADDLVVLGQTLGVNKVITILPPNAGLASMTTTNWQTRVKKTGNFIMRDFDSMESCREWLMMYPK